MIAGLQSFLPAFAVEAAEAVESLVLQAQGRRSRPSPLPSYTTAYRIYGCSGFALLV